MLAGDMTLADCPNPVTLPDGRRFAVGPVVLCGCPGDGSYWQRRHWAYQGVLFHCACGPREDPPGSGDWRGANDDGYACPSCARTLPGWSVLRRLVQDVPCCWCDGMAREGVGYRVCGHPAGGAAV